MVHYAHIELGRTSYKPNSSSKYNFFENDPRKNAER